MRCEVCGHKIHSEPITAIIEGARLTVCVECSKHGRIVTQDEYTPKTKPIGKPVAHVPLMVQKKKPTAKVEITQEIVEDFSMRIRQAREKLGLTHEDLGKKINEKSSVIAKLQRDGACEQHTFIIAVIYINCSLSVGHMGKYGNLAVISDAQK